MIAVDTNILVYAHRRDSQFHAQANKAVVELAEARPAWAIPWPCIHEFLAVVTSGRVFQSPTPIPVALDQVDAWIDSPSLVLLSESESHWPELRTLVAAGQIGGPRVYDARIAALCRQHGVHELWSTDRDFSRFANLNVSNPLTR